MSHQAFQSVGAAQQRFLMVQWLRGAAALSVAITHTLSDASLLSHRPLALAGTFPWDAGVDVFFVISGFVMVTSSRSLFGSGLAGARLFLARRIARVVPLYWVATTLFLLTQYLAPADVHAAIGTSNYLIASYFFLPWARPDGLIQPAYGLGWTLNCEMFFYLVFALCLCLPRAWTIRGVVAVLCGLALAHGVVPDGNDQLIFWTKPIILEFAFGACLAAANPRRLALHWVARLIMTASAVALFAASPLASHLPRLATCGLPALLLVAAATTGARDGASGAFGSLLVGLGDASYALYLVHPFVVRTLALVWGRALQASSAGIMAYVILCLTLSIVVAATVHRGFERPVLHALRISRPSPAKAAA